MLTDAGISATRLDDDWGVGWNWTSTDGVTHSIMLECIDVGEATYRFSYFAYRRLLVLWTKRVPEDQSDFRWLRPSLERLSEAT